MIKLIIIVIAAVLILSYFGISIRGIIESPVGQENLTLLGQGIMWLWENVLSPLIGLIYDTIILPLLTR